MKIATIATAVKERVKSVKLHPNTVQKIGSVVFDLDQSFKCVFLAIHGVAGQSGRCQAARPKD
jgi:hypothetical protein